MLEDNQWSHHEPYDHVMMPKVLAALKDLIFKAVAVRYDCGFHEAYQEGVARYLAEVESFVIKVAPEWIQKAVWATREHFFRNVHQHLPLESLSRVVQEQLVKSALSLDGSRNVLAADNHSLRSHLEPLG